MFSLISLKVEVSSSIKFSNLDDLIDDDDPDASFAKNIFPEKVRLRLKYIHECNFWLDIKLILLTLRRLIGIKWLKVILRQLVLKLLS